MATPLIEVIASCEQDIATYRQELEVIIAEADADGIRDEDEKQEIEHFETSIIELEKFVKEKRVEFEKNKAEWEGLSAKTSELAADYQTLLDWGETDLAVLDEKIGTMFAHEKNQFFRDAISAYETAQELMDPLIEAYQRQSAAMRDYDKERPVAEQRIRENRDAEAADGDIVAQLDQLQADLASAHAMTADLNFAGALEALRTTVGKIELVEKSIDDNAKMAALVQGAYVDLVARYNAARETVAPYQDLLDQLVQDFNDAAKTFGDLVADKKLGEAEALIQQIGIGIDSTLSQVPARQAAAEAEQRKAEEEEALLRAERAELATQLSAASPPGTLWKLYDWKNGDTFEKLASESEVKDASVIMGHPNNKKAADYFQKENELPIGTLVCVLDPTVKIYRVQVEGQEIYLTDTSLAAFTADNAKLMAAISAHLDGWFINLEKNNKLAYDARHMAGWITRYMTGWDLVEPAQEREAARKSVAAIQGRFPPEKAEQFTTLALQAFKDCETYKAALLKWLAEMQVELTGSMESLEFWDKTLKTVAVVCIVTIAAPASIPGAVLYNVGTAALTAGGAAASLSLFSDATTVVTAKAIGVETNITFGDALARSIKAGVIAGGSALIFGGIFYKIGPAIASRIATTSVVESQAARLLLQPVWSSRVVDMVKFNATAQAFIEKAGGTVSVAKLAPYVTPVIVEGYLKLFGRIAWGESVALRGYIAKGVTDFINGSPEVLEAPTEEAAAENIANGVLDQQTIDGIFDVIVKEHEVELEKILAEDIKKMNLQDLE